MPDRYDLYEHCVQSPATIVGLLRVIHGVEPRVLAEDFCGTAAISAEWVRRVPHGRAIAVDCDPAPLARALRSPAVELLHGDVVEVTDPARHDADIVWVGNFSIGERRDRSDLLSYLRHARARLRPGGVFVCDLYGGESALTIGEVTRDHLLPDGRTVRYTWEQRDVDHLTGLVTNAMHFRIERDGVVEAEHRDAFVYRWRLWGLAELCDAMREAGFTATQVYRDEPDAVDDAGVTYALPVDGSDELDDDFVVLVAARSS